MHIVNYGDHQHTTQGAILVSPRRISRAFTHDVGYVEACTMDCTRLPESVVRGRRLAVGKRR